MTIDISDERLYREGKECTGLGPHAIAKTFIAIRDEAIRQERERCAKIVDDHPLGYVTERDHVLLESYADAVAAEIRKDVP